MAKKKKENMKDYYKEKIAKLDILIANCQIKGQLKPEQEAMYQYYKDDFLFKLGELDAAKKVAVDNKLLIEKQKAKRELMAKNKAAEAATLKAELEAATERKKKQAAAEKAALEAQLAELKQLEKDLEALPKEEEAPEEAFKEEFKDDDITHKEED